VRKKSVYEPLVLFALAYVILTFVIPPDQAALDKYDLSKSALQALQLTIVIPLIAIWVAAFYGYDNLKRYAALLGNRTEGRSLNTVANGLGVLAFSLPVSQIVNTFLQYNSRVDPGAAARNRIIMNYLALAFALAAFYLINRGSAALAGTIKQAGTRRLYDFVMFFFTVLTALYSYAVFTNSNRHSVEQYALPDWLIIATIVIPYLFVWYNGFAATLRLHFYQTGVKGVLYRSALRMFSIGIAGVILTSVLLQFLATVVNSLENLGLGSLLAIVYLLLIVIAFGYLLIALGTKRLTKIEEV
jgi:hypothetical protein